MSEMMVDVMQHLTPAKIVDELNRHIISQQAAKRCVALALRNRWRRLQLPSPLKEEISPKNILMIGPTGVGKTEIARRLARLAGAPFLKVEATKFTEVGYVGRDVEQIIRDLVEVSLVLTKEVLRRSVQKKAEENAKEHVLQVLVGKDASKETREKFCKRLDAGELENFWIEIQVSDNRPFVPPMDGGQNSGMFFSLGDFFQKSFSPPRKTVKVSVKEALRLLTLEESDKLLNAEHVQAEAIQSVEQKGIVFIDEIDKICVRSKTGHTEISREGVQRDLLPLLEGTSVSTKYGMVKTDHILFIASGAFHLSKPSDLLPELQGRLPVRVELLDLKEEDFIRILTEPENNLIAQYVALLSTEGVQLEFTSEAIKTVARLAVEVNLQVENIGARRLHTLLEKLLEEISFTAEDKLHEVVVVDKEMTLNILGDLVKSPDLSRFIL